MGAVFDRDDIFIGGRFVPSRSAGRIALTNPATERGIGFVADADAADIDRAATAARQALPAWRRTTPGFRRTLLGRLADLYEARLEEFAALVSCQNGSVISRSRRSNGFGPVSIYRTHAAMSDADLFEQAVESPGGRVMNILEPVGVVAAIVPWNAPQGLLAGKLAPALLAGCTVVVKPSPETSLDALLLGELLNEAGFPAGVVNIVTGGRETGASLVVHPEIDMVSFTGSVSGGRAVSAACGHHLKDVTAELGGKSAAVVLDDADLQQLSNVLIETCLPNSGQVCYSSTRILAPASRLQEVTEAVTSTLCAAKVGEPMDTEARFGPLVSAVQRRRVEDYIASGTAEGARLVLGGGRPAHLPVGYYVTPTVFAGVTSGMRIFREEIFGPVLTITAYDTEAEAIRLANATTYGLGGSIFSSDIDRAVRLAREIETGAVFINGLQGALPRGVMFQGRRQSGVGGGDVLRSYQQTKSIVVYPNGF
ncbi:MAG: aldehyde dehydrogenase family protein [Rhizobiaceae bacterium]